MEKYWIDDIGKNWYLSSTTAFFYAEFVVLKTVNLRKDLNKEILMIVFLKKTHLQNFIFVEKHPQVIHVNVCLRFSAP